jgi:hypothetical protein
MAQIRKTNLRTLQPVSFANLRALSAANAVEAIEASRVADWRVLYSVALRLIVDQIERVAVDSKLNESKVNDSWNTFLTETARAGLPIWAGDTPQSVERIPMGQRAEYATAKRGSGKRLNSLLERVKTGAFRIARKTVRDHAATVRNLNMIRNAGSTTPESGFEAIRSAWNNYISSEFKASTFYEARDMLAKHFPRKAVERAVKAPSVDSIVANARKVTSLADLQKLAAAIQQLFAERSAKVAKASAKATRTVDSSTVKRAKLAKLNGKRAA